MYYFDQLNRSPFVPEEIRRGAFHADEVPYVFGVQTESCNPTEDSVSNIMMEYWANFVKTGNPNASGMPYWTEFKEKEASVMDFKDGAHLIKLPNYSKLQLIDEYYHWLRTHNVVQ
jgi:para-nitrobenzyl esterase